MDADPILPFAKGSFIRPTKRVFLVSAYDGSGHVKLMTVQDLMIIEDWYEIKSGWVRMAFLRPEPTYYSVWELICKTDDAIASFRAVK